MTTAATWVSFVNGDGHSSHIGQNADGSGRAHPPHHLRNGAGESSPLDTYAGVSGCSADGSANYDNVLDYFLAEPCPLIDTERKSYTVESEHNRVFYEMNGYPLPPVLRADRVALEHAVDAAFALVAARDTE